MKRFSFLLAAAAVFIGVGLGRCGVAGAIEFTIDEELPVGTVIGNVKSKHYDVYNIPTVGKKFHLFQKTSPRDLFEVDPDTGDIRVKGRIDRESLCPSSDTIRTCRIEFSIYQDSLSQKVDVTVQINDINDCKPYWSVPGNVIRVEFLDGDGPGRHKDIQPAEDKDLGKNSSIRYTLENLGAPFTLKYKRDESRLSIETSRMIDREEQESYNMTLVATDEGSPQLTGSIFIQITIIDVNDHAPEFDKTFYTPSRPIYEDEPVNNIVLRLHATDKDSGAYGTVVYDFAATTGDDQKLAREHISVQPDGRVLVRKPLDYDRMAKKYFYFEVIARDNARDKEYRRTATATVSISVLDRIDEAPTIETCFLPSGCTTNPPQPRISEGLPVKSKIAEVIVRDPDTGDDVQCFTNAADRPPGAIGHQQQQQQQQQMGGGQPAFKLVQPSGNYGTGLADPTASQMKTFDLVTNQEFDREHATKVCFEIVCRDSRQKEGSARYCIGIDDINDSPPVVDGPIVFQAIEEDSEKRPLPGRVKDYARDADEGKNSQLKFSLDPSDHEAARLFDIDADTGQLRPLVVFDREKQDQYIVRVLVSDKGEPPLSATATVTVRVADANDRHPVFLQPEYRMHIAENRPAYTTVGTVEARDEDVREHGNGAIAYRFDKLLSADDADWRAFTIDPRTGEIKTVMTLDREKKAHYTFRVLAEDQPKSGHVLTGTCLVSITVDDENDNRPVFRITPEHPELFQVTKREPGNSIGQVLAEDSDEGDNRVIEYELMNKAEINDLFSVDRRTGLVLINKALHGLPAKDYLLKLRACDRGRPRNCSAETIFRAHIADRKDAAYQGDGAGTTGGGGDSGEQSGKSGLGNEIVIVCLSVMFLVLGVATVTVVCLIVRKRSVYVKKNRQPAVAMAAGADIEHADVKMISGSYDMPPAYKDFNGEEEFCTYNTNLQLKPTTGTYGYRTTGKESRYCTTSPCPAGGSADSDRHHQDYQALDTGVRFMRRPGDSKHYNNSLHMYYEIKGAAAAAAGASGATALPPPVGGRAGGHNDDNDDDGGDGLHPAFGRPSVGDAGAVGQQPLTADSSKAVSSPTRMQHYPTFSPYTEASFV